MKTKVLTRLIRNLNRIFFTERELTDDADQLAYWKMSIFSAISFSIIVVGCPAMLYGALLFFREGRLVLGFVELLVCASICLVVTRKSLPPRCRKLFIVCCFYILSIMVLLFTGVRGAGMVCVLYSLILAGSLLPRKQTFYFISMNIIVFSVLTYLLDSGRLTDFGIQAYRQIWLINAGTTQVCGIVLVIMISSIYNGLERQNKKLNVSKAMILGSEIKHKAMIANISDVIMIVDEDGSVIYSSPNLEQKSGWTQYDFPTGSFWDIVCPEDQSQLKESFQKLVGQYGSTAIFEARCGASGCIGKVFEFTAVNMLRDDHIAGILINFHDVTERRIREDKILYLSEHDHLTSLYNRDYFDKVLPRIDTEESLPLTVIYGDVNGLKLTNDAFGHKTGDRLLVSMAEILGACSREGDIAFRIGGDEFLLVLPRTDHCAAEELIQQIGASCSGFNKTVADEIMFLSISLGMATRTALDVSIEGLIKKAEDGMYKKKLLEEKSIHKSILLSIQKVLFEKSQETEEHAVRLVRLSREIGLIMGLSSQQLDELELLAKLHDIGKIGIDKNILEKPSILSAAEWAEMKKHTEIGYRIAKSSPELETIADYIYAHHERWDGSGYPQQLKGGSIPLLSRIISVVDSYDAMTEKRVYSDGISRAEAVSEIKRCSGTQFDPQVVEIFLDIIDPVPDALSFAGPAEGVLTSP